MTGSIMERFEATKTITKKKKSRTRTSSTTGNSFTNILRVHFFVQKCFSQLFQFVNFTSRSFCLYFYVKTNFQKAPQRNVVAIVYRCQFQQHFMSIFTCKSVFRNFSPLTNWLCYFLEKEYWPKSCL